LSKYRLIALIGRGGMGDIYLAMARGPSGFKKLLVVKCLRVTSKDDESSHRMFLDEGRLAAYLNHPNVVQIYDVGEDNGVPYIAMEYLDGQPLSKLMRAIGQFDPRIAARIASDVLAGLHYAHELRGFDGIPLNIVHRDLSPPNILITYDGVVKVVDFGIAKATLPSRALTDVGILKGKVAYMAPEQTDHLEVDRRVDIFSMGVVLWEMLVGRRLNKDSSAAAALKYLLLGTFPPVSSERAEIDRSLERIVDRALEKDPNARYATALQMREDLEAYLGQSGPTVRSDDVGKLLTEQFAHQHTQMQELIQGCITAADAESESRLPVLASQFRVGGDSSASSISSSISMSGSHTRQPAALSSPDPIGLGKTSNFRHQLLTSRRRYIVIFGGVAMVFAGLLYGLAYNPHHSSTETKVFLQTSASTAAPLVSPEKHVAAASTRASESTIQPAQVEMPDNAVGVISAPAKERSHAVRTVRTNPRSLTSRNTPPRELPSPAQTLTLPQAPSQTSPSVANSAPKESAGDVVSLPAKGNTTKQRAPLVEDHPHVELVE
jgi:serine/threonine protein kinase